MITKSSQPLSAHRQRKHDAMIKNILDTARIIMREQGVAALSMQELARRMDMRAPSLYHYFSSKMDVFDALFRHGYLAFGEYMEKHSEGVSTRREFIQAGFEGYLGFAKQNPELYQLCFERPVPGFVPSEESLQVSFRLLNQTYERIMAFDEPIRTDLAPNQMVDLLLAIMHGITALHMANEPDLPIGQGRFGSLIPAAMELLDKAWLQP